MRSGNYIKVLSVQTTPTGNIHFHLGVTGVIRRFGWIGMPTNRCKEDFDMARIINASIRGPISQNDQHSVMEFVISYAASLVSALCQPRTCRNHRANL